MRLPTHRYLTPMLLLTLCSSVGASESRRRATTSLRVVVPAYFYPAGDGLKEWDRLLRSPGLENVIAIVNPASGPGASADANYTQLLERARKTPIVLIGYVTTSYAKRPVAEVKADVDRWLALYPGIDGIFFDEQASAAAHVAYYGELHRYARKARRLEWVVENPGTFCEEAYLKSDAADATCLFEGPYKKASLDLPAWTTGYPASAKYVLPYAVGSVKKMREVLAEARRRGAGVVYVTDAAGTNPWRRLPRYWEEEMAEVMRLNEK